MPSDPTHVLREDRDDADALPWWLRRLDKHAEIEHWSKREKLPLPERETQKSAASRSAEHGKLDAKTPRGGLQCFQ